MKAEKNNPKMDRGAVQLAPSILAADFARLGEQVAQAEQAGADRIHVDVMDGHFVPNISMGAPIVHSLRQITRLPLETHLMISDPDFFLDEFVEAGSDSFDAATAPLGVAAGANVLVAGSAIFGDGDGVTAAMNRLRAATEQAVN